VAAAGLAGESTFVRHLKGKELTVAVPFHRPGLQGVVTVVKHRGWSGAEDQLLDALLVNGVGMTVKVVDTKMMAHLPLFLHPDPQDTLVICFGMGTTYRSAVSHGGNVTAVELVPEVYDAFPHFYADAARVLAYPKGRLVVNDGRNFLKLTDRSFDVITLDPPPPIDGAGVVNLYSREFIELAKSRLKKGGILAHWVPLPGSKAGVDSWDEFNALVNTFVRSFPYVCGTKGPDSVGLHLLGSLEPILPDGARIAARYAEPAVAADLREWELVPPSFFAGVQDYREGRVEGLRLLTDDDPWLEFYLLRTLGAGGRKTYPVSYW
jgi:spermidine synthase